MSTTLLYSNTAYDIVTHNAIITASKALSNHIKARFGLRSFSLILLFTMECIYNVVRDSLPSITRARRTDTRIPGTRYFWYLLMSLADFRRETYCAVEIYLLVLWRGFWFSILHRIISTSQTASVYKTPCLVLCMVSCTIQTKSCCCCYYIPRCPEILASFLLNVNVPNMLIFRDRST